MYTVIQMYGPEHARSTYRGDKFNAIVSSRRLAMTLADRSDGVKAHNGDEKAISSNVQNPQGERNV